MIGRAAGATYVALVARLAVLGFAAGRPPVIALGGLLVLPLSLPAAMAFYGLVGVLALVPGANADSSSASGSCSAAGDCVSSSTGGSATWFLVATDALGVSALVVAAVVNVLLWRLVLRRLASGSPR